MGGVGDEGDLEGTAEADTPVRDRKRELRSQLLAARRELGAEGHAAAGDALRRVALGYPGISGARTVAAYVSVGSEPDTRALLDGLRGGEARVLLPVLLGDGDLDWAPYEGAASLRTAGRGLLEPVTPRLGVDAVRAAGVVIVPAVAVDVRGFRLGRGGGSYDRVLARLGPHTLSVATIYEGEMVDAVPTEPHDRAVGAALTPAGVRELG